MDDRRPLVIAFLVAVGVLGAAVIAYFLRDGTLPEPPGRAEIAAPPAPGKTDAASSDAPGAPSEGERIEPPSFDVVRVDAAGTAVIAGRGAPSATAVILANGGPLAEAPIDKNGEWAAYVDKGLPSGAVELSLLMRMPSGRELRSDQVVVVAVPEPGQKPLVVLGRPGGASRILQSPLEDDGLPLALLAVDYDEAGGVIFTGRGVTGSRIRVLANGAKLGETEVGPDADYGKPGDGLGPWSLIAGATLAPGVYDLQIDQLNAEGRVTAVIALPFERAKPEDLAEIGPRTVIVQPGNSLWRIARRLYGSGWQYTVIYSANKRQIRDPDLIYPGQVFDLPEGDEEKSKQG